MSRETGEDVIYMRNSNFHEMNMSEDTAPRMSYINYHENITMDDAVSEIDNTRIPSEAAGIGEPLELRSYQLELAQHAVLGINTIIVAPTGSGKTHVAMHIAKLHLEAAGLVDDRKVVFIVPTVSLVNQQKGAFVQYLSDYKTVGVSGDKAGPDLSLCRIVPNYDIFVVTPQILLDVIDKDDAEIEIDAFSLLIFDECHHTDKGHPYNKVMARYLDKKLEGRESILPQVVGLTASVGVGKAKDLIGAEKHILKLCANMDAQKLSTVQKERRELLQFTNRAREGDPIEVQRRQIDPFKDEICKLMQKVERKLSKAPELHSAPQMGDLASKLGAPPEQGNERYTQWVNSLTTPVIEIRDADTRRLAVTLIKYLKMYNDALIINADCQTKDALDYIHKAMDKTNPVADDTEKWLIRIFEERNEVLENMCDDPRFSNPKLDEMQGIIPKYFNKDPDSRGIIFCRTRATTVALERWMSETPELKAFNPKRVVAANAPTDKGGMVQSEQNEALRLFREGRHRIIIATSVAEEGLDVQACNFVIRYEHVTNETARIQSRGRARKPDAEYLLVTERGRGTAQRDEINRMREDLMNDAIRRIDVMDMADFRRCVEKHQKGAKLTRNLTSLGEKMQKDQRSRRPPGGLHRLLCVKCSTLVCLSIDIRRVEEVHHVVIDDKLKSVARYMEYRSPVKFGEFDQRGKLKCRKCDQDWGVVARYSKVLFPVLKLANFVLEDECNQRKCYKQWKKVPFTVSELTEEDMQNLERNGIQLVPLNY